MAGRPKSINENKVFDVAKPNKSKPLGTSRPVIVNHASAVSDDSVFTGPNTKEEPVKAPSESRKVIKPIRVDQPKEESSELKKVKEKSSIVILKEPEPVEDTDPKDETEEPAIATAPVVDEDKLETGEEESEIPEPSEDDEDEVNNDEAGVVDEEPEEPPDTSKDSDEAEKAQETAKIEDEPGPKEADIETGGVDVPVDAASKSKEEQKVIEEQAKQDTALQELIDSKKYFVPLAHDNSTQRKGHSSALTACLIIVLLAAGVYLAIDAKLINISVSLPYHFFQQ